MTAVLLVGAALWWDDDRPEFAADPRLGERVVAVGRAMGREPATPAQVRERLGIGTCRT